MEQQLEVKPKSISDWLNERKNIPHRNEIILDVRSPGEFAQGHIPGAKNLPLLDDLERHQVGLLYRQNGYERAFDLALGFAQGKFTGFVQTVRDELKKRPKSCQVWVYCYRGGQRSASMSWLLEKARITNRILEGGYKKFRHIVLDTFTSYDLPPTLILLGGKTGSGKSMLLDYLKEKKYQVIDLEGLAQHRGSVFGGLGQTSTQPTQEMFENLFATELLNLDGKRAVWLEAESSQIGKIRIPHTFKHKMEQALRLQIEVPRAWRVQRIVNEYGKFETQTLIECVQKIERKLGGLEFKKTKLLISEGKIGDAVEIILNYYDKNYQHAFQEHTGKTVILRIDEVANESTENSLVRIKEQINEAIAKIKEEQNVHF